MIKATAVELDDGAIAFVFPDMKTALAVIAEWAMVSPQMFEEYYSKENPSNWSGHVGETSVLKTLYNPYNDRHLTGDSYMHVTEALERIAQEVQCEPPNDIDELLTM